jgi:hypothetical protein
MPLHYGYEFFFLAADAVVNVEVVFHVAKKRRGVGLFQEKNHRNVPCDGFCYG